jgi:hypothetical protein
MNSQPFSGFLVDRADLQRWRWEDRALGEWISPAPGQILVETAKFAFTSNNVTYARLGSQIPYWRYFPVPGDWGYIPVWGLATVILSRSSEVKEGECIYGYFPMASHLLLQPSALRGARFIDAAAHRQELPPTYNEYVLVDRDPGYDRAHEDQHLVLRPLFSLSYFCSEWLKEERYFGARQIVISSASSKTSLGLAFLLAQARLREAKIVGLTSPANVSFVMQRGVYDQVLPYTAVSSLAAEPSVFIDIAGDAKVRGAVHRTLAGSLKHSARVGFTHWDALDSADTALPGPSPKLFFTPDHIVRLRNEWGMETLALRLAEAWQGFLAYVTPWLGMEHAAGKAEVERVYLEVLGGKTPPDRAHLLSVTGRSGSR